VPSLYAIKKQFSSFAKLIEISKKVNCRDIFADYCRLKMSLKRCPTNSECATAGVNIKHLQKVLSQSKTDLDDWATQVIGAAVRVHLLNQAKENVSPKDQRS
jgi:hypothetical protein